ncbi:hypothetical protein ACFOMD_15675 [Sphingoaurantiacus capsulatus]|uniref:Phenylacetate--CoA ligase family protein n=1 Tax=Sphingoaurantiacus capsulatus TaxID=1771310 RepID=A0ABV7XDX7_9SPHN
MRLSGWQRSALGAMCLVNIGKLSPTFRDASALGRHFAEVWNKSGFIDDYQRAALVAGLACASLADHYRSAGPITLNHFTDLPPLSKDIVIRNPAAFRTGIGPHEIVTTGGSTGETLTLYMHRRRKGAEWYWMSRIWAEVGFDRRRSVRAVLRNHVLRGRMAVFPITKEIAFDNFNLDDAYIDEFSAFIEANGIEYLHAYPSAAAAVGLRWATKGNRPRSLKAVLCGSEFVYPAHRALIEGELGLRLLSWYGHSEKLALAGEYSDCRNYHANPFYGLTEFLDPDMNKAVEPGQVGEIVATGFINPSMALLRYRTGDMAEFLGETCPDCGRLGRAFRMKSGRAGEWIHRRDGSRVSTTALNLHDSQLANVSHLQLFQPVAGEVDVLVVPRAEVSAAMLREIEHAMRARLGADMLVRVRPVDAPQLGRNGKAQLLVRQFEA